MKNKKAPLIAAAAAVLGTALSGGMAEAAKPKPHPVAGKSYSEAQRGKMDAFVAEQQIRSQWLTEREAAYTPDVLAYNEKLHARAMELAGEPAEARTSFQRKFRANARMVLTAFKNPDKALSEILPLEALPVAAKMSLTERGNLFWNMLAAYHEERQQGLDGMVAVTHALGNRADPQKPYRGAATVRENLALTAQFSFMGEIPPEKMALRQNEPQSWDLAFKVAHFNAKNADMAMGKNFLTEAEVTRAVALKKALGGCRDYLAESVSHKGWLAEKIMQGYGEITIGNHIYLVPPVKPAPSNNLASTR
jgi:hypothetical protein